METIALSKQEYKQIFPSSYHVFNGVEFNVMNAEARQLELHILGFKSKKYKLGIIGSIIDGRFQSPFSAPFGGFSFKDDVSLQSLEEAVEDLILYCQSNKASEIILVLPPLFYEPGFISKLSNVLYRKQFALTKSDLNYSIHLEGSIIEYSERLKYNAKKNLAIAVTKGFTFLKCEKEEEKQIAYEVIQKNREERGFPLRMSYQSIQNTSRIIDVDFFLVKLDGSAVASALIFHVAKRIVQVVYWGDLPEFSVNKTMNFLSYQVVNYYYNSSIKVIDIGPSTEASIPNYGLCEFKEGIGCTVFPKQTWSIKL